MEAATKRKISTGGNIMSVTIRALVVAGIRLDGKDVTETVTKFNENTGAPYEKKTTTQKWFLSNTAIEIPIDESNLHSLFSRGEAWEISLEWINDWTYLIGIVIASTKEATAFNLPSNWKEDVALQLRIKLGLITVPELWVAQYMSY
jgi:hypothetical protein